MVTNVCFGAADLRTAFATLSMTGKLVSFEWPRPGLKLELSEQIGASGARTLIRREDPPPSPSPPVVSSENRLSLPRMSVKYAAA